MQRPERSGLISVLIVFGLFNAYFDIVGPHQDGPFSVICFMFAPVCWDKDWGDKHREAMTPDEIRRKWHTVMLYPPSLFPSHAKSKKLCTCHIDLHFWGKAVDHLHQPYEPTCDSDFEGMYPPMAWTKAEPLKILPVAGVGEISNYIGFTSDYFPISVLVDNRLVEMRPGQGEFRTHCDGK